MSSVGESIWQVFHTCIVGLSWGWVIVGTDMDISNKPRPARPKSIAVNEGMRGQELFYTKNTSLSYVKVKKIFKEYYFTVHIKGDVTYHVPQLIERSRYFYQSVLTCDRKVNSCELWSCDLSFTILSSSQVYLYQYLYLDLGS